MPDEPVQVEVAEDGLVPWERALTIIKNLFVVATCIVILYTAYVAYHALAEVGDSLQQVNDTFGGSGG